MDLKKKKLFRNFAACAAIAGIAMTLTGGMMGAPGGGGPPGGGGGMGGPPGGDMGGGTAETEQAAQQTVVEARTPELGSIAVTGSFVGTVEPGIQVTVYPKASGEVLETGFAVGDAVSVGDVLFKLDSSDLELDITQARQNLATSQANAAINLEKARRGLETAQRDYNTRESNVEDGLNSSLLNAENSVKSAEISLHRANLTYSDASEDYADYMNDEWTGDYSDSQREQLRKAKVDAEIAVETAQLQLENAKAGLAAVEQQVSEQAVTAEDSIEDAEINLKSAELGADLTSSEISLQKLEASLADYTVASPIDGIIEQINIDAFDTVSPQTASYVISNKDSVTVAFEVAESALSYLNPGNSVTVEKNGETCAGVITEVSTMVDSGSGLYVIKASVQDAPFELRSGSSVKLRAETQKIENEMVIPIDAVYHDNGIPYVFVYENGTARRVDIALGISDENMIHVESGLAMTDNVIVTYSENLYDGAEVSLPGDTSGENAETDGSEQTRGDGTSGASGGERAA